MNKNEEMLITMGDSLSEVLDSPKSFQMERMKGDWSLLIRCNDVSVEVDCCTFCDDAFSVLSLFDDFEIETYKNYQDAYDAVIKRIEEGKSFNENSKVHTV